MHWWESISIDTQDFKGIFLLGDEMGLEGQDRKLSCSSVHVLRPLGIFDMIFDMFFVCSPFSS